MKYTFDPGPLALDDATILLGEIRKVVQLISIAAQGADHERTTAMGAICATADLAGEKIEEIEARLDALRDVWMEERKKR
ncbi:hypothetical protein GH789_04780 [Rhizobium pusense]|uniref:hypothetical protein n=1 Tax=Agrobacterium pusense TaxID=648995 RepID=UPI00129B2241|nr:hypothetical protein [Agrobacterium pusense]MRG64600.1 hypothetical protein [Agrobacterium pusense]